MIRIEYSTFDSPQTDALALTTTSSEAEKQRERGERVLQVVQVVQVVAED